MTKLVRYNGEKVSYKGCDSPTNLVNGKVYEVLQEIDLDWQTNYTLKELDGEFNSIWFEEVNQM